MKTIYKYEISIEDTQTVELPLNSEILCVQTQNNKPYIWVVIDLEEKEQN